MWMRSIFSRERSPTPHIPRGGAQRPPKFLGPLPTPKRFDLERRNLGTVVREFLQAECPLCHPTDSIVAALEVVYFMSRGEQRFIHLNNEGLLMQVGGLRVKYVHLIQRLFVKHHSRSAQVWHVFSRDHSFTCTPKRSSAIGMSHTCLCLPSYGWYSFTDPV